ncbi:MAG: rbsR3 [Chloroflexi bacterium]|nr:rbsR3 [Chloroflexota bacterium]
MQSKELTEPASGPLQAADMRRPATLVDVAFAAKVSIATASRAINGRRYVSDDTRAQVLRAAEQLNFRPSSLARGFRAQRSQTVGMIVPDISSPFYAAALRGAQHVLSRQGYTVLVCDTEEQPQREREALDLLTGQRVAGLILAPVASDHANLRQVLARQPMALVAIDNRLEGRPTDTVLVDNVEGARTLTAHLLEHGHRRIGHISGILSETSGADRLIGYQQALADADIDFDARLVAEGDWSEAGGYAQAMRLLDTANPPTAIVIASSLMAVGTLLALRERNIPVPGSIAVACFDDAPWAPLIEPSLTALCRQDYALGAAAAELILVQLGAKTPRTEREHRLPMTLVVRRSCGCNGEISPLTQPA